VKVIESAELAEIATNAHEAEMLTPGGDHEADKAYEAYDADTAVGKSNGLTTIPGPVISGWRKILSDASITVT